MCKGRHELPILWINVGGHRNMSDAQIFNESELKECIVALTISLPLADPLPNPDWWCGPTSWGQFIQAIIFLYPLRQSDVSSAALISSGGSFSWELWAGWNRGGLSNCGDCDGEGIPQALLCPLETRTLVVKDMMHTQQLKVDWCLQITGKLYLKMPCMSAVRGACTHWERNNHRNAGSKCIGSQWA